jgi:hypothetical protein
MSLKTAFFTGFVGKKVSKAEDCRRLREEMDSDEVFSTSSAIAPTGQPGVQIPMTCFKTPRKDAFLPDALIVSLGMISRAVMYV